MSNDYNDAAYERTCVMTMQRIVLDRFLESDSPAKEVALCEEVFVHESEVPQAAWQRFFEKLGIWENDTKTRMSEYKWTKDKPTLPFLTKQETAEKKNVEAKSKKKRSRKTEPGPEGGSQG